MFRTWAQWENDSISFEAFKHIKNIVPWNNLFNSSERDVKSYVISSIELSFKRLVLLLHLPHCVFESLQLTQKQRFFMLVLLKFLPELCEFWNLFLLQYLLCLAEQFLIFPPQLLYVVSLALGQFENWLFG